MERDRRRLRLVADWLSLRLVAEEQHLVRQEHLVLVYPVQAVVSLVDRQALCFHRGKGGSYLRALGLILLAVPVEHPVPAFLAQEHLEREHLEREHLERVWPDPVSLELPGQLVQRWVLPGLSVPARAWRGRLPVFLRVLSGRRYLSFRCKKSRFRHLWVPVCCPGQTSMRVQGMRGTLY